MKNLFKKLFIPSGEKTTIIAYKSWVVRWNSIQGSYNFPAKQEEAEVFVTEEDAYAFAMQLEEAVKLTKSYDYIFKIRVEPNQSKLATINQ